ncbi:serine/threonine-protein kinase RsbW [Shimia isoporae]|uniref:Serine/threonine-protein kinase RsbW n=1 Tax=Shimia isoporae TaxID=647720 RepID=A0A4R1N2M4_9RHOB|nr:ATP-binding protein [Shimia isoporae]TCL00650.1 serine/threonine-protein kinase RsbW [Shimia isoporae]
MIKINPDIHIELEGTPHEVRVALETLRERLTERQLEACNAGTLEIVLAEVLNNVVEHALADRSDGLIALTGNYDKNSWHLKVRDNGKPMPDDQIPSGNAPDVETDLMDLPEGGFGWMMVRTLARNIAYSRADDSWNELTFSIPDEAA